MADNILTLKLTNMAHGGTAVGRDEQGRPIFVTYVIPGETARVRLTVAKERYGHGEPLEILQPSPDRVAPRCPHFGICGGCHLQHMTYERQLQAKQEVMVDQLRRIGSIKDANVRPTLSNPQPWSYANRVAFSPTPDGKLGFWSPQLHRVMDIDVCYLIHPDLLELFQDIDIDLPDLRKLTLRRGSDGAMLAAFEVEDVEPPSLEVDFPVSVAIVLPDNTAASLIGDPYLTYTVKGRDFRVSPGCDFPASLDAGEQIIDTVLRYAALGETDTVLELYGGVGLLTAFLAEAADAVATVEVNPDAIDDMAANLADTDNVTVLEGDVAEIVSALDVQADVMVVNPDGDGLPRAAIDSLKTLRPRRLVYVSSEVAILARDGKQLTRAGYRLAEVQPIDMWPQTYQIDSVSLWLRQGKKS